MFDDEKVEQVVEEEVQVEEATTLPEPEPEPAPEPEPEPAPAPEKPADTVPLSKFMAEKRKRQELERVLSAQQAERDKLDLVQQYVTRGWPEVEARLQAEQQIQQRQAMEEVKEIRRDQAISDLARSDPFYADAETYKDDLMTVMREKDITAAEAYDMRHGRRRLREVQVETEQRAAIRRREAVDKKVENAPPAAAKNPYPLDEADRKALAGLQKAQPDGNWSAEKYWKLMKQA